MSNTSEMLLSLAMSKRNEWFGDQISDTMIEELKAIKHVMATFNKDFVFENPPDKGIARAWDMEDWQLWLDQLYFKASPKENTL